MSLLTTLVSNLPAWVGTAVQIGGAVTSVAGLVASNNAEVARLEHQAKIDDRNALVADRNRLLALQTAKADADDRRRKTRRTLATIRASYGHSGVSMAGSPLDVLADTATEEELDARRIEAEGGVRAYESALDVLGFRESAEGARASARGVRSSTPLAAFGAGFRGAGNVLSRVG